MAPNPLCRWFAVALVATALGWLPCPFGLVSPSQAGGIYVYTDEQGVLHMTNVKTDPRYASWDRGRPNRHQPTTYSERFPDARLVPIVHRAARSYGLDPALVRAVIQAESAGDAAACSPKGALGLMQLMPDTAYELSVADPLDPQANVWGGTCYLRQMLDRFDGNVVLALAAYNAGPRRVEEAGGVPSIPETHRYIRRVLLLWQSYRSSS